MCAHFSIAWVFLLEFSQPQQGLEKLGSALSRKVALAGKGAWAWVLGKQYHFPEKVYQSKQIAREDFLTKGPRPLQEGELGGLGLQGF